MEEFKRKNSDFNKSDDSFFSSITWEGFVASALTIFTSDHFKPSDFPLAALVTEYFTENDDVMDCEGSEGDISKGKQEIQRICHYFSSWLGEGDIEIEVPCLDDNDINQGKNIAS